MFALCRFPLTAALGAVRALPVEQGVQLRHAAMELMAHEMLSEMHRIPQLASITLTCSTPKGALASELAVTYEGANLTDRSLRTYQYAFPAEFFAFGTATLDCTHPAVLIARTEQGGLDTYFPAVSGLARELSMSLSVN